MRLLLQIIEERKVQRSARYAKSESYVIKLKEKEANQNNMIETIKKREKLI